MERSDLKEETKEINYRPISLSTNVNKIFIKIIKNDQNQGEEQVGFREGYSTVDHIFMMNQLIKKTREYNIDAIILLIDFKKALNSIKHFFLWQAMANQNVPKGWLEITAKMYKNSKAHVKTDIMGLTFTIGRG